MIIGLIVWVSSLLMSTKNKKMLATAHDPCDPSKNGDPFDPWPMTHWPISISGLTDDYESRSEVGHWLHLFYGLSFLQPNDVSDAFAFDMIFYNPV